MSLKDTTVYHYFRKFVYLTTIYPKELYNEKKRKKGILNQYSELKQYKGIHEGKRCFIVATGPSLTEKDFFSLKNEYTIGVNGLCLWFKEKKMETDYFVVSDDDVYNRIEGALKETKTTQIFVSERVAKTYTVDLGFKLFPVNLWNRFVLNEDKKRLSNDISVCSYDEETVVFHAIQLAIFLGFKLIYLLGTDCNYDQKKAYSVDHGKKVDTAVGPKMIRSYYVVKKYEDLYGFKVFNATKGGMLEVFPRVNLEDVLKEEEK